MSKALIEKVDMVFKMARVRRIVTIGERMHLWSHFWRCQLKMWRTQYSCMWMNEDKTLPHLLKMKNAFWKKSWRLKIWRAMLNMWRKWRPRRVQGAPSLPENTKSETTNNSKWFKHSRAVVSVFSDWFIVITKPQISLSGMYWRYFDTVTR